MSVPVPSPMVFLVGPTGTGKTATACALANELPLEIISVDSAQVYRGLNIGTAKPSAAERTQCPHWLIDLIDPAQAYSAARFVTEARSCLTDIRARGKIPLFVGGTMLYARALVFGLDELPSANQAVRAELEHEAARLGWPALHSRLAKLDPATAARLAPGDSQRISRALEVVITSGTPLSALHQRSHRAPSPSVFISLEPNQRKWLHERLAQRFDAMLGAGLIEEVQELQKRGDLHTDLPALRSVGYRQVWSYLHGEGDLAALRERGTAATRQLAKRQLTWLRSMPEREVIACDAANAKAQAVATLRAHLQC